MVTTPTPVSTPLSPPMPNRCPIPETLEELLDGLSRVVAGASALGRTDVVAAVAPCIGVLSRALEAARLERASIATLDAARARRGVTK
jgi:hypothetical protein